MFLQLSDSRFGQIVIAGKKSDLDTVAKQLRSEKLILKLVSLPVSAPFHSRWMKNASSSMKKHILSFILGFTLSLPLAVIGFYDNIDLFKDAENDIYFETAVKSILDQSHDSIYYDGVFENEVKRHGLLPNNEKITDFLYANHLSISNLVEDIIRDYLPELLMFIAEEFVQENIEELESILEKKSKDFED